MAGFFKPGGEGTFAKNYAYEKTSDPWFIITEAVEKVALNKDDTGAQPFAWLTGLVDWANPLVIPVPNPGDTKPDGMSAPEFNARKTLHTEYTRVKKKYDDAKCLSFTPADFGLCALEAAKAAARAIIVNSILANRIDLSSIRLPDGKNANDWVNENLKNLVPPEYRYFVEGANFMPLDLTDSPIRRYMLEQAYEEIWRAPLKDEWYEAISNEMRNARSGSLAQAITFLRKNKYGPKEKAPVVKLSPDALKLTSEMQADPSSLVESRKASGPKWTWRPEYANQIKKTGSEGFDPTWLVMGGVALAAVVGLGIYLRKGSTSPA